MGFPLDLSLPVRNLNQNLSKLIKICIGRCINKEAPSKVELRIASALIDFAPCKIYSLKTRCDSCPLSMCITTSACTCSAYAEGVMAVCSGSSYICSVPGGRCRATSDNRQSWPANGLETLAFAVKPPT
jgi:hypothetical protein